KKMAEKVGQYLDASLETGEYNRATPITLRKLRVQVQRRKCPSIVSSDDWLNLTKKVLSNPRYSHGDTAAYIHIERAYLFEHRRQLNPTMLELEAAWEAQSTPELAQLISATLLSAGLYDPAEQWAHRALEFQIRGLRGLFSNDEE